MRLAAFCTLVFLLTACSEKPAPISARTTVQEFGVCIDLPADRYTMDNREVVDFNIVEIRDTATRQPVANVYIGHNPNLDRAFLDDVETHRAAHAARSPIKIEGDDRRPGAQYLGVPPPDSHAAFFHVMFGNISQREQSGILRAIHFCN